MIRRSVFFAHIQADLELSTQAGGYDVEQFVEAPDYDLICSICQGVLRCPVRAACHHIFCKKCLLQWLKRYWMQLGSIPQAEHKHSDVQCLRLHRRDEVWDKPGWLLFILCRQETCPCCRKHINPSLIFIMFKLSKSIGCMKIKVGHSQIVLLQKFLPLVQECKLSSFFAPPDSVKTRSAVAKKPFASRSSTATAWRACTSSSHVRTRAVECSSSAGTWTLTSATVNTGAGRATWAAAPCCPTPHRLSTTAISSWGWSTRPGRGTTGPSPWPCRGRWGGCRTPWRTWSGR